MVITIVRLWRFTAVCSRGRSAARPDEATVNDLRLLGSELAQEITWTVVAEGAA
jgi:hypothetical protein